MKTVTLIEVQKRNKDRANVHLDGEYAFSLGLVEAARLRKGQTLSDAEIAALRGDDAVAKAVDSAARFLAYRPRSTAEVRRNLAEKGVEPAVVEAAVERLSAMGHLDDLAFARFWVQNRTAFKPLGPVALRYELRQKGVGDDDIEAVLESLDPTEAAYTAARAQLRRIVKGRPDARAFKAKLSAFLGRRGFSYAVISEVTARLWDELEDVMSAPHDEGDSFDAEFDGDEPGGQDGDDAR